MGWVVNATPRPFYPQERRGTHCIGGWVGPRAGLDGCGKSPNPQGFDPRTVHPVASSNGHIYIYADLLTVPDGIRLSVMILKAILEKISVGVN
jgi:hypothetical protein